MGCGKEITIEVAHCLTLAKAEFEDSLVYIVISRLTKATQWDPVSK